MKNVREIVFIGQNDEGGNTEYHLSGDPLKRYLSWADRLGFPAIPPNSDFKFDDCWPTWKRIV